jgi:excisionase family DNA binding protein
MEKKASVPILIPLEPEEFWAQIREIIREEVSKSNKENAPLTTMETPGLTEKPLYKMQEICSMFKVTKPTIYDWIKHGKLRRVKIRSRVYFLGSEIKQLLQL